MRMKSKKRRVWIRILAFFLILSMLITYYASSLIDIKIAANSTNEAINLLAENTEYLSQNALQRLWYQMQMIQNPTELEHYYRLASTKIAATEYEKALPYIEKCMQLCPSDDQASYLDLLTKKGCLLTLLGQNEEAINALESVVEADTARTDVYLVLAQIFYEMGNLESLSDTFASYLGIVPEASQIRLSYAQLLMASGELDAAATEYQEVLRQSNYVMKEKNSTNNAEESNDEEISESSLEEKSVSLNENNVENLDISENILAIDAIYGLSLVEIQKGEFGKALIYLNELEGYETKYPDINCNKGLCFMQMQEFDQAIECYTKSIEAGYTVQYSYYARGICELSKENAQLEIIERDLKQAVDYSGTDRDEETATLAQSVLDELHV